MNVGSIPATLALILRIFALLLLKKKKKALFKHPIHKVRTKYSNSLVLPKLKTFEWQKKFSNNNYFKTFITQLDWNRYTKNKNVKYTYVKYRFVKKVNNYKQQLFKSFSQVATPRSCSSQPTTTRKIIKWQTYSTVFKEFFFAKRSMLSMVYSNTETPIKYFKNLPKYFAFSIMRFTQTLHYFKKNIESTSQVNFFHPFFLSKKIYHHTQMSTNLELSIPRVLCAPQKYQLSLTPHSFSEKVKFSPSLRKKKFFEKAKLLSELPNLFTKSLKLSRSTLSFYSVKSKYFNSKKLIKLGDFHDGQLLEGPCGGFYSKFKVLTASQFLLGATSVSNSYFKHVEFVRNSLKDLTNPFNRPDYFLNSKYWFHFLFKNWVDFNFSLDLTYFPNSVVLKKTKNNWAASPTQPQLNVNFKDFKVWQTRQHSSYLTYFTKAPVLFKYSALTSRHDMLATFYPGMKKLSRILPKDFSAPSHLSNLYPAAVFNKIFHRHAVRLLRFGKFLPNVIPVFYQALARFVEVSTGKSAYIKLNPHVETSLTFTDIARCQLWEYRVKGFQKILGPKIFLKESIRIVYMSLKYKDPVFLMNWVCAMLTRMSFWKYRKIFKYLKYLLRVLIYGYLSELKFKGVKLKLKGKISVAGNARTRTLFYRIGQTSNSTFNHKIHHSYNLVHSFTGVMGFQLWFYFIRNFLVNILELLPILVLINFESTTY